MKIYISTLEWYREDSRTVQTSRSCKFSFGVTQWLVSPPARRCLSSIARLRFHDVLWNRVTDMGGAAASHRRVIDVNLCATGSTHYGRSATHDRPLPPSLRRSAVRQLTDWPALLLSGACHQSPLNFIALRRVYNVISLRNARLRTFSTPIVFVWTYLILSSTVSSFSHGPISRLTNAECCRRAWSSHACSIFAWRTEVVFVLQLRSSWLHVVVVKYVSESAAGE